MESIGTESGGRRHLALISGVLGLVLFLTGAAVFSSMTGYDPTYDVYTPPVDAASGGTTIGGGVAGTDPFTTTSSGAPIGSITTVTASPPATVATTTSAAWGPVGPIQPVGASASAERAAVNLRCTGQSVDYRAGNLIDRSDDTGWGASSGDGAGQSIRVSFSGQVRLTRVGIVPGYARYGPRQDQGCASVSAFNFNRIVTRVRYRFDDGTTVEQSPSPSPTMQMVDVDTVTSSVEITIVATTRPPGADNDTVVSAASFEGAT